MADNRAGQESLVAIFTTPAGNEALRYLRRLFKERVQPPGTDAQTLTHIEGQRYVIAHIEQLLAKGQGVDVGTIRNDLADGNAADGNAADPRG